MCQSFSQWTGTVPCGMRFSNLMRSRCCNFRVGWLVAAKLSCCRGSKVLFLGKFGWRRINEVFPLSQRDVLRRQDGTLGTWLQLEKCPTPSSRFESARGRHDSPTLHETTPKPKKKSEPFPVWKNEQRREMWTRRERLLSAWRPTETTDDRNMPARRPSPATFSIRDTTRPSTPRLDGRSGFRDRNPQANRSCRNEGAGHNSSGNSRWNYD